MLTIREPIVLKTNRSMQGIRQDMTERIQANYDLMNLSVRKEELLHITSQPPEIYFAEGENLQILTNIHQQNQQEIRLDVINNLMNRILVAQTDNFTYQDTVYISNVLRKLGIRDEKTFMKQVFSLQNEQKETRNLLQSYEANQEILQQLFLSDSKQEAKEAEKKENVQEKEIRLFLHNEIFKRLETGKVYQDMSRFSKNILHESQEIYSTEMQVAEQARIANNFLLQDIKNKITKNNFPLQYFHNNRYEYLQEITEEITEELEEQISAAILLNLTDQTYALRQQQIEENHHSWYSIANSLFQTAENTWRRYEANLLERKHFTIRMEQMLEETNNIRHQEGDVIHTLSEEYRKTLQQWNQEQYNSRNMLEQKNIRENLEQKHFSVQMEQMLEETNNFRYQEGDTNQTLSEEYIKKTQQWNQESYNSQDILIQKNTQENLEQKISMAGGSYQLSREELELNFLKPEESEEEKEETALTVEQLQKQLKIYSQKNYENYQKITEIGRQQKAVKDRKVDRRKAQMDALRALENPGEVLKEYLASERKEPLTEMQEQTQKQIYELFSEETKEIYRQYLLQNTNTENTFLQHIMAQPEESEVRQEVVQVLEQIEQRETLEKVRQEVWEKVQQVQPVMSQTINEEIKEQLIVWRNLQEYPPVMPEEDEFFLNREAKEIFHIQEEKLTGMKETIENRIVQQQIEKTVLDRNIKREMENRQIDFIHKTEEKLNSEELLEEIRMQNQRNIKTGQTEEITITNERDIRQVVQDSVNHVQTNRVEDIEEIVQQSVKRQLNNLSEQVYGKLEKKLQTERKRRGYF